MENGSDGTVVTRCRAVLDAMAAGAVKSPDVSSFVADLSTLPARHPQRGELAATMLTLLTNGGGPPPLAVLGDLGALLDMVDIAPPQLLAWPQARTSARAMWLAHEAQHERITTAEAGAGLDELAAQDGGFQPTSGVIEAARHAVQLVAAYQRSDESSKVGLLEVVRRKAGAIDHASQRTPVRDALVLLEELLEAQRTRDLAAIPGVLGRIRVMAAVLGVDPAVFALPGGDDSLLDLMTGPAQEHDGLSTDEIIRKYAGDDTGAVGKLAASYALVRGGVETDLGRVERAVELAREAAAEPGPLRDVARNGLAINLWRRAEVLGTTEGLDEAQRVLEELIDDLRSHGGSASPLWTDVNDLLSQIRRRVGDQQGSGAAGIEAMYRFAHKALVESDPANARLGLREAATLGIGFARQRLLAGDYTGGMHALDTARGLMLFAEVEVVGLAPRLRAAGREDLANRCETAGPLPPGLRAEAVDTVIADVGGIDKLLKLPSPAEVGSALGAVDADALVYLVPADEQQSGMALVVPREGKPATFMLPQLSVHEAGAEGYLAALSHLSRELTPAAQPAFTDRLDELCDWAWRAAIGPLLERYLARDEKKRGREPRIVLIPMAELAAIPWQAARNREGTYAVELAAFSQAVSAREFCLNAARPRVRLTSAGLVVGDPSTEGAARDLPAARLEAYEVRKAFLRSAKYVGRRPNGSVSPSGAGTVEQVRAWLAADGPTAGAVLHLACHGQFTSDEQAAKASLVLSPGATGERELRADEIVRLLHGAPHRQIGLVVMAACHTGRSVHGYDEAYSLGTALLAGGVRTVLSTQWAVPDEATSMLMYLFHHYLRTEKLPPRQALRAAQLCMLRPGARIPDAIPEHLRELISGRKHAGVVGWAGFIHSGH